MAIEPRDLIGRVVEGVVVFENGETLPDGTRVKVEPLAGAEIVEDSPDLKRLREMLLSFAGAIDDPELPPDLAQNLDHYLYGTPMK